LFGEVYADLFDLVYVLAAGVYSLSGPSFSVPVAKVGEYGLSDRGAGDVLARD